VKNYYVTKKYDINLNDIEHIMESIKKKDFEFMKEEAVRNWLEHTITIDVNAATVSWIVAVLTVLQSNGFEIKKKELP
jgi:hypothetical protein